MSGPENALTPYLRAVRHHRWLLVLTTLLALGAAGAYLAHRKPRYETTAQILVTPLPQADDALIGLPLIRDSGDPTRTLQTAASLIDSPQAASAAAQAVGGPWTRAAVESAVKVEPQGQSDIVAVTAKAGSPQLAASLANAYARGAIAAREATLRRAVGFALQQVQARRRAAGTDPTLQANLAAQQSQLGTLRNGNDPTLAISSPADVPTSPVGASKATILVLAFVAGLAIGLGAALLLELLDRRVREEEEIVQLLRVPVLARVPFLPRRVRSRPNAAFAVPAVREAYRTMQIQLEQLPSGGRKIMVTSSTKGDGKTSSAISLAAALVGGGSRVALIDFDLRKPDVGNRLDMTPEKDLVLLLAGSTPLAEILASPPGLPALRVALADPSGLNSFMLEALARRLPSILEEARQLADYVIVDTPPLAEVGDALRVLPHVDEVIIVSRLNHSTRRSLQTTRELLDRAGRPPAGVVLIGAEPEGGDYYGYRRNGRRSALPPAIPRLRRSRVPS